MQCRPVDDAFEASNTIILFVRHAMTNDSGGSTASVHERREASVPLICRDALPKDIHLHLRTAQALGDEPGALREVTA